MIFSGKEDSNDIPGKLVKRRKQKSQLGRLNVPNIPAEGSSLLKVKALSKRPAALASGIMLFVLHVAKKQRLSIRQRGSLRERNKLSAPQKELELFGLCFSCLRNVRSAQSAPSHTFATIL